MDTGDLLNLLTFLFLTIPYGILWVRLYRESRHKPRTALNYTVMVFLTIVSLMAYHAFILLFAGNLLKGDIQDIIMSTAFSTLMWLYLLILPTSLFALVLWFGKWVIPTKKDL